ncbi:hypothetical protein [Anaerotardibacter muris]|uniref:hypothetical protein n=1 Tax=Anaerotardibacter muris TaxID=2941505 RepID=UPI002041AAF1|nr:hypothetical protein [Anaerotardibacter muris]
MKFTFINESKGFIDKKDIVQDEKYNIRSMIISMLEVRTAKDFIKLTTTLPYSFFAKYFFEIDLEENIEDILSVNENYCFKGSIEAATQKYFIDIDYLDELVVREGVLGNAIRKPSEYRDGDIDEIIKSNGRYEYIFLSSIDEFIQNAQRLLFLAALASRSEVDGFLERKSIGNNTNAQIVRSGLCISSDYHSERGAESALHALFDSNEITTITETIKALDDEAYNMLAKGRYSYLNKPFIVKESMTDSEIAAFIFTWFMNALFEDNYEAYYSCNTFKVDFENGRFTVRNARNPVQEFYYEIAKFAESGVPKLCANCGRVFVDDKSRGTEALYCSRSCNTQASNKRKDLAKQYKKASVPVEKAIAKIGAKYEKSIRSWYQD